MTRPGRILPAALSAALIALLVAAAPAIAQQKGRGKAAQPESGERFDDWRLGCERRPGASRDTCFVEQRLSHKDDPERLALAVAIGYFAPDGKPAMIVKLPPAAIQEAGIIIRVDDRPVREVGIRNCGPDSCAVLALLDDDMLAELRAGQKAVVAYSRKDSEEVARVPVSLRGLTRGLAALRKRG
ncbi:invasion associated locus B family protein [Stella sp.]|uniref:invasion associated locus B family protein n=1 Tax=Stella sp. TaxID=2912054 RepID=UPI0035B19524